MSFSLCSTDWIKGSAMKNRQSHGFPPFFFPDSSVLILGSFPSVKSREEGFYYANPLNRFYKVLSLVYGEEEPKTLPQKKDFLRRHHIALSDAIDVCEIENSSDSTISEVTPMDFAPIFKAAKIEKVICNGKAAATYFFKFNQKLPGISYFCLPSTSSANASCSLSKLVAAYSSALI